jgi:PAS domain S-box-containing protein
MMMSKENGAGNSSMEKNLEVNTNYRPLAGWELNLDTLQLNLDPAHQQLLNDLGFKNVNSQITLLEYAEQFVHSEAITCFKSEYHEIIKQKDNPFFANRYLIKFRTSTGETRKMLVNASAADEHILHGFIQDITEYKSTVSAEASLSSIKSIIEHAGANDYIFIVNTNAELVICNSNYKKLYDGLLMTDIQPGFKLAEELPAEMKEEWMEMYHQALTGEHVKKEMTFALNTQRYLEVSVNPVVTENGITGVGFFVKDITTRWRNEQIGLLEKRVMEQSFKHEPLLEILETLLLGVEAIAPKIFSYITMRNGDVLEWTIHPRIPAGIIAEIPMIPIAANCGSCGEAAFSKKNVMVMDIRESENWLEYKDIVLLSGFSTSLAFPILNKQQFVLGTVGCFCKTETDVTDFELELIDRVVKLASLLIEKNQFEELQNRRTEQLQLISEHVPGIFYQKNTEKDGTQKIVYLSNNVKEFYGYSAEELLENYDLVLTQYHPDDIENLVKMHFAPKKDKGVAMEEFRLKNLNGEGYRSMVVRETYSVDNHGEIVVFGNVIEVTENSDSKIALQQNQNELNAIIKSLNDVIFQVMENGEIVNVWTRNATVFGCTLDEILKCTFNDFFGVDCFAKFENLIRRVTEAGDVAEDTCKMNLQGEDRYFNAKVVLFVGEKQNSYLVTLQDNTELRAEQEKNKLYTNLLSDASEMGNMGAWTFNHHSKKLVWSNQLYKIFEVDPSLKDDELFQAFLSRHRPDNLPKFTALVKRAEELGEGYTFEHHIITPTGREKIVSSTASVQVDDTGKVLTMTGVCQDVTDWVNVQKKSTALSELLEKASEMGDLGAWSYNFLTGEIIWSDQIYAIFEISKSTNNEELHNQYLNRHSQEDILKIKAFESRALEYGEDFEMESRIFFEDGRFKIVYGKANVVCDDTGKVISISGISKDITKRKMRELEFARNLKFLEEATRIASVGAWELDIKSGIRTWSAETYRLYEVSTELTGVALYNEYRRRYHPDDLDKIDSCIKAALADGKDYRIEHRIIFDDGRIKYVDCMGKLVKNDDGEVISIVGVTQDITDKKEREFENQKLSLVAKSTSNAVMIMDAESKIEWVNEGFEKLTGYELSEIVGKIPSSFLTGDETCTGALANLRDKVKNKESGEGELLSYHKSGRKFWAKINMEPVFNDAGELQNFISITSDQTELKKMAEATNANLKEKELLLSEIHHRVKNNLAIISSLLQLQQLYASDGMAKEMFKESQGRINSMALVHEKLYQNSNFSKVDFHLYTADIFRHIQAAYPGTTIDVQFVNEVQNIELDITTAVPCGLILNELLTNCYKYAFKGRKSGEIKIAFERKGEYLVLEVKDNGVGLPSTFAIDKAKSMGMIIVKTLTTQLKGKLSITGRDGTSVILTFPVKNSQV